MKLPGYQRAKVVTRRAGQRAAEGKQKTDTEWELGSTALGAPGDRPRKRLR